MHLTAASFTSAVPLKRQRLINKISCQCPCLGPVGLRQVACDLELPLANMCKQAEASADVSRGPALGTTDERIQFKVTGRAKARLDKVRVAGHHAAHRGAQPLLGKCAHARPDSTVWQRPFQAFQAPGFVLNGPTCLTDTQ